MERRESLIYKGLSCIFGRMQFLAEFLAGKSDEREEENKTVTFTMNGAADKTVFFSKEVLDDFRSNVGRLRAETGGMLASSADEHIIDRCHFDMHSQSTPGTFYYDVESMSKVFREWKKKGYITNGIYHSHPKGSTHPSYHDISSALLHIDFFGLDYFYLPIFQPERSGFYTMYLYVVKKERNSLSVNLDYVLQASEKGYGYLPFRVSKRRYSIQQLNAYRQSVEKSAKAERPVPASGKKGLERNTDRPIRADERDYFSKISSLYPEKALDKVIVCIGTGGARSFLENCARSGFRNYILIDADVVSPSNVATQGVFISEMGKKKVHVIRDRIRDINPCANVVCVGKFLDDAMSDGEFRGYMDKFPDKEPEDYLILGCTDNFEAQKRSALLALKYGCPYLAAMMYEGGAAAEIIFVYPGVTESCPRCLLRERYEKYENGFKNDVDSSACPIFATERMNALKGYIALMLLMYHTDPDNPFSRMLDDVKDRNFVEIRLNPYLKDSKLGIGLFDKVFADAGKYTYMDETIWLPQHPDHPQYGSEPCKLCGGTGDLRNLRYQWSRADTRDMHFTEKSAKVL